MAKDEKAAAEAAAAEARARVDGQLAAYRDALAILKHHASLCLEADSLAMDTEDSIRQRIAMLEAEAKPAKGKGK